MAKYINIGNTDFASVRKDEYVDKSQLIAYINHVLGTQRNDHSAEGAIRQIKEKQYIDALSDYVGEVVLVGVNYDKKTKQHECVIERLSGKISDKFPINGNFSQKTSDKLQKILLCMQSGNGVITQAEVSSMFGVSDRQARNYLDALVEQGYVLRMGANKDRTYKLK